MLVEIALFFTVLIAYWYYANRLPPDYPPTPPIRLPIIGHLHYLVLSWMDPTEFLANLYEKYNRDGIMVWHMGPTIKMAVVGDYGILSELYKNEGTNYRISSPVMRHHMKEVRGNLTGREGIIFNEGLKWQEQRRFMLTTLRDFGFGKSSMEDVIAEEVEHFKSYLDEQRAAAASDGLISVQNFFNIGILNVLWRLVAGRRFEYGDPKLQELMRMTSDLITTSGLRPNITMLFPFLAGIADPYKEHKVKIQPIRNYILSTIEEHEKNFDPDNPRDFIDVFLKEMKENGEKASSFHPSEAKDHLHTTLSDLFFAGSETTSSTLSWAILFMIRHPDVQDKVREEIHRVVGRDWLPTLADRTAMVYTEATIMEVQRMGNIVPRGLPHSVMGAPVRAGPYTLPSGHTISGNFASILQSEKVWGANAKEFDPTRFISVDGASVVRKEELIPFSVGKRICPGEGLARVEIFLFFAGLLQTFIFEAENPAKPPELRKKTGITSVPLPFSVRITNC